MKARGQTIYSGKLTIGVKNIMSIVYCASEKRALSDIGHNRPEGVEKFGVLGASLHPRPLLQVSRIIAGYILLTVIDPVVVQPET
jgi:hypothetical protein